jgi:hypothetical protein
VEVVATAIQNGLVDKVRVLFVFPISRLHLLPLLIQSQELTLEPLEESSHLRRQMNVILRRYILLGGQLYVYIGH